MARGLKSFFTNRSVRASIRVAVNHLRLFRSDAAVFSFGSFLAGGMIAPVLTLNFAEAGLVTLVSANFCYSFNAWTDRESDRINKPHRPIPAGEVTGEAALRYSMALFVISLGYPFLVAKSAASLFWFLVIPFLGLFYSARPVRLKNRPPFSVLTVAAGLTIPFILGYIQAGGGGDLNFFFMSVFLFCASLVGLKDIEDEKGDTAVGEANLYHRYKTRLLDISLAGLAITVLFSFLLPMPQKLFLFIAGQSMGAAACILVHRFFVLNRARLYRRVIKTVMAVGTVFWLIILTEGFTGNASVSFF